MILPAPDWRAIASSSAALGAWHTFVNVALSTVVLFVVFYALEAWHGADMRRYRTIACLNDVFYRLFYLSGLIGVLVYAPIASVVAPHLPWSVPHVVASIPLPIGILIGFLVQDFAAYWFHRFQHSRIWWRFHRLHHSAEALTFLTGNRAHPVDVLLNHWFSVTLAMLGATPAIWLPYRLVDAFLVASFHAELPWHYGRLGRVFVSPVFHAVHHSRERGHADHNFGSVLAIWDILFGTAVLTTRRPTQFGLDDYDVPESVPLQLMEPVWRPITRPVATDAVEATSPLPERVGRDILA